MSNAKKNALALYVGGGLSMGMGAFHLFLPTIFGWTAAMRSAPSSLQWALSSLNVFWSLLILLTGALAIVIAWRGWQQHPAGMAVSGALACYWALHAMYLVAQPFPLPRSLAWLGWSFVAFAAGQALLHARPLLWTRTGEHRA
jgi:hypothetical protein